MKLDFLKNIKGWKLVLLSILIFHLLVVLVVAVVITSPLIFLAFIFYKILQFRSENILVRNRGAGFVKREIEPLSKMYPGYEKTG